MNKYIAALFASFCANIAFATTWYVTVDAHNADYGETGETASGESWDAAITLTNAVAKAQAGDTILVEGGTYDMTKYGGAVAVTLPITIKGGMLKGAAVDTVDTLNSYSTFDCMDTVIQAVTVTTATSADDWNEFERCVFTRGKRRGFSKTGATSLKLIDCKFSANGVATTEPGDKCSGRGGYFSGTADSSLIISNCVFNGNTLNRSIGTKNNYGSGILGYGAYFATFKIVDMDSCTFITNGIPLTSDNKTQGGTASHSSQYYGYGFYATACSMSLNNCKIIGNRGGLNKSGSRHTTGIVYLSNCIDVGITNCLFSANSLVSYSTEYGSSKKDGILMVDAGNKGQIFISKSTFAYNLAETKDGSAGISVNFSGTVNIDNSIFFGNLLGYTAQYGADLHVAQGTANVRYCSFGGDNSEGKYVSKLSTGTLNIEEDTIKYGDPMFVTSYDTMLKSLNVTVSSTPRADKRDLRWKNIAPLSFDFHLLSKAGYKVNDNIANNDWLTDVDVVSPLIDAGEPGSDFTNEPAGSLGLELGYYGNTPEASKSLDVAVPVINNPVVGQDPTTKQPKVTFETGISNPNGYYQLPVSVIFTGVMYGDDEITNIVVEVPDVIAGKTYEIILPEWFKTGSTFDVKISFEGGVEEEIKGTEITENHPLLNVESKDNVVYYWTGAIGRADGSSWLHAYKNFDVALAALGDDKDTLWIAGDIEVLDNPKKAFNPNVNVAIVGGFSVTESEDSDEIKNVSTIDGYDTYLPFNMNNANKVSFKRIKFTKGVNYNFYKAGAGDCEFLKCEFSHASKWGHGSGGTYYGTKNTKMYFTDCLFANNLCGYTSNDRDNGGLGAHISTFERVYFTNCRFVLNGNKQEKYTNEPRSSTGGAALYLNGAPVTMNNCSFIGNRQQSSYYAEYSSRPCVGVIRMCGAGHNSVFTNCVWSGNEDISLFGNAFRTTGGGIVAVEFSDATSKAEFVNCTFANNVVDGYDASAGINVKSGDVNVLNSIFYGAVTSGYTRVGKAIHVAEGSKASIAYSLFESESDCTVDGNGELNLLRETCKFGQDPNFVYSYESFTNNMIYSYNPLQLNTTKVKNAVNKVSDEYENVFNVHLRSSAGYYDEITGEFVKFPRESSPAVDAGKRLSEFNERAPHGNKVNLGFYGNTPWATMSSGGFMIIIR